MKFLFISLGSRGDMEPFLAQARIMADQGHIVACCFPEQFRQLVDQEQHTFYSLGSDFLNLLSSEAGQAIMGGIKVSCFKRIKYLWRLYKDSLRMNREMFSIQEICLRHFKPDHIIFHPKTIFPFCVKDIPKTILSPVPYLIHSTSERPPVGVNFNAGPPGNKLLYKLVLSAMQKNIIKVAGSKMKEYSLNKKDIRQAILQTDVLYMVSKYLFNKPKEYPAHTHVLGFAERNKSNHWTPSKALEEFISRHNKVVMLTFGSMVNGNAKETTELFLNVLEERSIPTIINTSAGGLEQPEHFNSDLFFFTQDIPYEWVFPKLYGVIHHGGSGTTHMATKYGCVSLIIPHIVDQFLWNKIIAEKELGPLGVSIRKIKKKVLNKKIKDFYLNPVYKEKAIKLSRLLQNEKVEEEVFMFYEKQHCQAELVEAKT